MPFLMYYEMTGTPVEKLMTIMVAPKMEIVMSMKKETKVTILKALTKYVKEFVNHKLGEYGERS